MWYEIESGREYSFSGVCFYYTFLESDIEVYYIYEYLNREDMDENGGSFMGKSKDILCFSWLLLCLFCTLRRVKLWFFCSAYFVRFNKCWLVLKESDHIVVSFSISSPKHVVLTWIEPSPCFNFFFSLSMVCFTVSLFITMRKKRLIAASVSLRL